MVRSSITTWFLAALIVAGCGSQDRQAGPSASPQAEAKPVPVQTEPSRPAEPEKKTPEQATQNAPGAAIQPLSAIQFIDSKTGWAVGNGQIIGTTDGGASWAQLRRDSAAYTALDFVDADHGWVLGPDVFLRTSDGGKQWTKDPVGALPGSVLPQAIDFISQARGWATDGKGLFETADGGVNWRAVPVPGPVEAICRSGDSAGWAAGGKSVYRTTDGGKSWRTVFSAPLENDQWTPELHCSGEGAWVLFRGGAAMSKQAYAVFRTLDGGAAWQPVLKAPYFSAAYPSAEAVSNSIDAYPGPFKLLDATRASFLGACPACGNGGTVSLTRTGDGGTSFTRSDISGVTAVQGFGLEFVDADHGWIAASVRVSDVRFEGAILATTDGGKTWRQVLPAR